MRQPGMAARAQSVAARLIHFDLRQRMRLAHATSRLERNRSGEVERTLQVANCVEDGRGQTGINLKGRSTYQRHVADRDRGASGTWGLIWHRDSKIQLLGTDQASIRRFVMRLLVNGNVVNVDADPAACNASNVSRRVIGASSFKTIG